MSIIYMKRYLFFIITLITSLLAFSCQDEDFGFTQEEVFKGAYERNFEAKYGKIDPNQSWDLSRYARGKAKVNAPITRGENRPIPFDAESDGGNSYYRIEDGTLNWIDNKLPENQNNESLGTAFGMLLAGQQFIAIPISQKGANESFSETYSNYSRKGSKSYEFVKTTKTTTYDWTLYMVTLENGEYPKPKALWSKSTHNNIQTPQSDTQMCDVCEGRGMVDGDGDVPCEACAHEGWLPMTDPVNDPDCPKCNGTKTEKGECTKCDAEGHITCTRCKGDGYYPNGNYLLFIPKYHGCQNCLEKGEDRDVVFWPGFLSKTGNGIQICKNCDGTKITDVECSKCHGDGKMKQCSVCKGSGYGIKCTNPQCDKGFVTLTGWEDIDSPYNTGDLGTHLFRSAFYEQKDFPEGSVVYFYMEVTPYVTETKVTETWSSYSKQNVPAGELKSRSEPVTTGPTDQAPIYKSSLSHEMIILNCPRPNKIDNDWDVMVIGCEQGDNTNKDFNDLVFLVIGRPLPEIFEYTSGKPVSTSYYKRYMIEDMGSAVDWDFNDIVIDVSHDINRELTESGGIVSGMNVTNTTKGIVRYIGGTIPIRVQIGDTFIPGATSEVWIDDPTDIKATYSILGIDWPKDAGNPDNKSGWSPESKEITITGYDPDENNITIWSKQGRDKNAEVGIWKANFPKEGSTPYIIATDQTIPWIVEGSGDEIPDKWWNSRADTSTPSKP